METKERVILVGVQEDGTPDIQASLQELRELARTAGAETVGQIVQNLEKMHPVTYIGKGKIDELKRLAEETDANGIICDDELTPAQMKNLEDRLDLKVMDRTILILDIFAAHASTREGKVQVELAQARYRMTRLAGFGQAMSRLGGGIGTRGPGESRLETDRRRIRQRITSLKQELKEIERHREVDTPGEKSYPGRGDCRVYERGQIHAAEPSDRRGRSFGRQAFRDTGSDHKITEASGR